MGRGKEELVENFAWAGGRGGGRRRRRGEDKRHAGQSAEGERHSVTGRGGVTTGTALLCSGVWGGDDDENENGKRTAVRGMPPTLCQALGKMMTAAGIYSSASSDERV